MSGRYEEDIVVTSVRPAQGSGPSYWETCEAQSAFFSAWDGWLLEPSAQNYRAMCTARRPYCRAWCHWLLSETPAEASVEAEIRIVDFALLGGSTLLPNRSAAAQDVADEAKGTLSVMRQLAALLLEEAPVDGR